MASAPLGRSLGPGARYSVNLPKPKSAPHHSSLPSIKKPTLSAGTFTNPKQGAGSSSTSSSIFGSSQLGLGGSMNPFAGIKYPTPLTAQQQAAKNYVQAHAGDHSSGGFMGLVHDAGDVLGKTLDIISRPANAMASAGSAELAHNHNDFWKFDLLDPGAYTSALHGFSEGLRGHTHKNFAQDLEQGHILNGHSWIRSGLGLGMDIAGDPLNLIGGAGVVGKGENFIKGLQEIDKAGNEAFLLRHAPTYGPALLEHTRAIESKALKDVAVRTPELEAQIIADNTRKVFLEQMANKEARANLPKYLGIRLGVTKAGSVTLRTPIKIGKTLAEREGALAAGKLGMRVKSAAAHLFAPGYMNPIGHAAEITARHAAERLTKQTWDVAISKLGRFAKGELGMSVKEQQVALIAAETKGTVKDGRIVESALAEALTKHGITGDAAVKAKAFVHAWHDVTEHLHQLDIRHGVEYGKGAITDRVYIPHVFEKGVEDGKVLFSKSNLSKAGFELHGHRLTYAKQLEIAGRKGGRSIVQDPIELLGHRIAKGGQAASHGILRQVLRDTVARPTRYRDIGRYSKAYAKITRMRATKAALEAHIAGHEGRNVYHRLMQGQTRAAFQRNLDAEVATNSEKIATLKAALKTTKGRQRGTLTRSLNAAVKDQGRLEQIVASAPHEGAYTEALNTHGIQAAKDLTTAKSNLDKIGKAMQDEEPRAAAKMWRKNPDALQAGWKRVEALSHKGPDGKPTHYTVPAEVHTGIANIEKAMLDPKQMNLITKNFAKALSTWKVAVTSVNPGYRIRNSLSDLWNMYIAGVPAVLIPKYARQARQVWWHARKAEQKIARLTTITEEEAKLGRPLTLDEYRASYEPTRELTPEEFAAQYVFHGGSVPVDATHIEPGLQGRFMPQRELQSYRNLSGGRGGEVHLTSDPAAAAQYAGAGGTVSAVLRSELTGARWTRWLRRDGKLGAEHVISDSRVPVSHVVTYSGSSDPVADMYAKYLTRHELGAVDEATMRREYNRYRNVGAKGALGLTQAERDAVQLVRTAHDHGVLSGLFAGDVGKAVNRLRTGSKNPISIYARKATSANTEAENLGRLTHYLYRLKTGHSEFSAAEEVKAAHFDYEDLSEFEQRKMKLIAPFYTWTRKNVPYQIMSLARNPGRVATYGKVANTSGQNPHEIIGHALDYHPLAVKFGNGYIDPQIGLNDLYNIEHPTQELQNINPAAQLVYTAATGRNFQTGQALSGPDASHQAVPAPGILSNLLQPFGLGERTQRMVHGVEQPGPGVNPWVAQIADQIPLGSYLMSRNPIDEARKGTTPFGVDPRTLSYLGGINYTNVDKQNEMAIAQIEQDAATKAYIKHLRDQGLMAPSDWTPGKTWFDKYLRKMANKSTRVG